MEFKPCSNQSLPLANPGLMRKPCDGNMCRDVLEKDHRDPFFLINF